MFSGWRRGAAVGLLMIWTGGCRSGSPTPSVPMNLRETRVITAQSRAGFHEAQKRFRARDREGAVKRLEALMREEGMSPEDRTYLMRQIRIVKGEPGGLDAAPARRSPGSPPATNKDCGPRALQFALSRIGVRADLERLCRTAGTGKRGTNLAGLAKAAQAYGIRAVGVEMDAAALKNLRNPAVAWWGGDHFVALLGVEGDFARIRDPNAERESEIELEELVKKSGGIFLTLSK